MGLKAGYMQTEVGVIPEDWEVKPLGDIGESLIGLTYRPADVRSHGTLVLRASNIQDGTLRFDDNVFVQAEIPQRIMLRPDDILVCVRNGSRDLIGKSALIDDRANGMTFGAFMAVFRSRTGRFISYLFQSEILTRQINAHLGATINQITNASLKSFRVPFPPTDHEKHAIAETLRDVDALLGALEKLIAKKRDLKEAAIQQLLSGQTRLPSFQGEWAVRRLDELGAWRGGMTPSMQNPDYWNNGTVPWISSGDVKTVLLKETALSVTALAVKRKTTTLLPMNSIVIVTRSGILRKFLPVAITVIPMAINQDIKALIPTESFNPKYVLHALIASGDRILASCLKAGTTVESVDFRWLKAFTIPVPPLPEQSAVAEVLSEMDAEIAALEQRLAKTRALKQGMMQELLTGRTRLVRPAKNEIDTAAVQRDAASKSRHTWAFNEAVVIAALATRFGSRRVPLSRVRYTKLAYLLHRQAEKKAEGYLKKAAGPYNPRTRYGGPEKIAQGKKYVAVATAGSGTYKGFVAGPNSGEALSYFNRWYGAQALQWLEQFRFKRTEYLGLLTTVDTLMQSKRLNPKPITAGAVRSMLRHDPDWKHKLQQEEFSETNIKQAIAECRVLFQSD